MAAFTHAVTLSSTSNTNVYTTGAFTPAADDLLVAVVGTSGYFGAITPSDSQGIGWTEIATALYVSSARREYLYVANAKAAASSMTFTATTEVDTFATGANVVVARLSGMSRTGSAAVRQSQTVENHAADVAPATPTISFAAACLTGNPTLGCVCSGTNPPGLTEPTSWTEQADAGHGAPNNGIEYVTRDSGFTGTDLTWLSSSANAYAIIAVEFDTSAATTTATSRAYVFG